MVRRLLTLAGVVGLLTLAATFAVSDTSAPPAMAAPGHAPSSNVVLIGTSGLTWADVTPESTPTLWSLTARAGAGTLSVHTLHRVTCPVDGWLSVSSGRLAAGPRPGPADAPDLGPSCPQMSAVPVVGVLPGWSSYLEQASSDERDAEPGLLGHTLSAAGVSTAAIGPGAAIALADLDGTPTGPVSAASADPAALAATVEAAASAAELVVVDVGPSGPDDAAPTPASLAALDARVATVRSAIPDGTAVIVASLGDIVGTPHLQVLGLHADSYDGRLLWSQSTRQPGLLQITDVPSTVLGLLGVPEPAGFVGAAAEPLAPGGTTADRVQQLSDYDVAAHAVARYVGPFFVLLVGLQLLWYIVAGFALRHRTSGSRDLDPASRLRWLRTTQWLGVGFAAVPIATYPANLVPWWRAGSPFLTLIGLVLIGAGIILLAAMLGPWRTSLLGPLGVVTGITALTLAAIVLTGSRLLMAALMGVQPLVSGRFYGLGNVPFALFATGSLLVATVLADHELRAGRRGRAIAVVAVIGAAAIALDGAPGLGSDFGGPIAIVPAFTVLALTLAQIRLSWRAVLSTVATTVGVVAALSILDYLRPPADRTHLGQFVATIRAGEGQSVLGRKFSQNLELLFHNPPGLLVPVVAAILVLVVVRPRVLGLGSLSRAYERAPALRPGMTALLVLLALGFAFNDSGTAVPAVAAALVVPLLVGVGARISETDLRARAAGVDEPTATGT